MNTGEIQYMQTSDGLISSKLGFRLQLQSLHFGGPVPSPGNSLTLRCTAHIGNLYQEYSEIELGVPQRDPIPARGKCFYIILLFFLAIISKTHLIFHTVTSSGSETYLNKIPNTGVFISILLIFKQQLSTR